MEAPHPTNLQSEKSLSSRLFEALRENGFSPDCQESEVIRWLESAEIETDKRSKILADTLDLPFLSNLGDRNPSVAFVENLPINFSRQFHIIGLVKSEEETMVVIADLKGWQRIDTVRRLLNKDVSVCFSTPSQILTAVNHAYQQQNTEAQQFVESMDDAETIDELNQLALREDLLDSSNRAPIIKLVNMLLFEAVKQLASDVHIQPSENRLSVRMRIDGVLSETCEIPKVLQEEVISRIKVLGRMNIAEKRLPQDGRATVQVGDRLVDLRIASLPTNFGERAVIRLLDKGTRSFSLEELGMPRDSLLRWQEIVRLEHGLILVTGPTGSGKSTTLYATFQEINSVDLNVLTLEDPIEYQLEGISQTQINEKKGMTFAAGVRNVLRQDPDVIMVGEIRDHETSVMTIQSALTGHLVFSTLHTNDAASAITRMLDLGIEPYLIGSSLVGVLAQRLVRKICEFCTQPYEATDEEKTKLDLSSNEKFVFYKGEGCDKCRETGYHGRVGLFEMMLINDSIREQIQNRNSATPIRNVAVASGMQLLRHDGIKKILEGTTTSDEVIRVSMRTEM